MRPLKLTLDGFACFKEYQEIDFTGLDLFAISGPTGAGKSSILDAMVFALYGKVPRLQGSLQDLISLGRDKLAVTLEFSASGRRWFVSRALRRGRSAEAMLEEVGVTQPRTSGGIKEVNLRVQELLGLPYEAFIQAVLLPQGQFAQFLKNVPAKRREILRELLRLNVYERMREAAQSRKTELATQQRALDDRLEQDHAGSTEAHLQAMGAELAQVDAMLVESGPRLAQEEEKHAELKRRHSLTAEWAALRHLQDGEDLGKRVELARRAAAVLPLLEQRNVTRSRLEEAQRAHAQFLAESTREAAAGASVETLLLAAQEKADSLPRLEARLHALDELKGILETRPRLARRLQEARQAMQRASSSVELSARALANARDAAEKAEKALAAVQRPASPIDEEQARAALMRLERCAHAHGQARESRQRAAQRLEEAERISTNAEIERNKSVESWNSARQGLAPLETAHLAHRLARDLKDGEPCPVCGHDVDVRSGHQDAPPAGLEAAEAAVAAAGKSREMAEHAWQRADATRAQARQSLVDADAAAQQAEASVRDAGEELHKVAGPGTQEEVAARLLDQARAARERHQAELAHGQATLQLGKAEMEAQRVQSAVDVATAEAARIQQELAEVDERIGRVSTHPDPTQERAQLAQDIRSVRETLRQRQQEASAANTRRAAVEARLVETAQRVEQATGDAAAASDLLEQAWPGAGFPSESDARGAAMPLAELDRLEARAREQQGARQRLVDLEKHLGGKPVDDAQLAASQRVLDEARATHQQLLQQRAVLHSRRHDLEGRVRQAQALHLQRDAVASQFALHETLALDLRNDRFQAFLLQEAFAQLVAGASLRLMELTGRYTFELRDDEFFVLDHDNARERRSADTLSGGETFLASLALALELSDQVQRAAGATALDSLFIDEGFATLDGETLEVAASAVECLPVGGRMVGIITHLPALTQRLPARLMVEKRADGSRIHVERA